MDYPLTMKGSKFNWNLLNNNSKPLTQSEILNSFGFDNLQDYLTFQNKTYQSEKHSYKLLNDWEKFLGTLKYAKEHNKNIIIFGDYDADGITGAATLYRGFLNYGIKLANLDFILPNRDTGYSIQFKYIDEYLKNPKRKLQNVDLIITVDCGINSKIEIDRISQELNIKVGVTDHHSVKSEPSEFSLFNVNPNRLDSTYPFKAISGSLVALKMMEAIYENFRFEKGNIEELEDIACIGTIADVMPIRDENFFLARDCLKRFHNSTNPGIKYFTSVVGSLDEPHKNYVNCDLVGMRIAPRINAVGRIDDPRFAFFMLINTDEDKLKTLYTKLDETNTRRKEMCEVTLKALEEKGIDLMNNAIILEGDIHDGIIGLMAGKVKEKYNKPTICFTIGEEKNTVKCSGRSIDDVHLLNLVDRVGNYFLGYGGHKGAFGGSMIKDNLEPFKKEFYSICNESIKPDELEKKLEILGIVDASTISGDSLNMILHGREPFGHENREKLVMLKGQISSFQINNNKHTFITISTGNKLTKAIFWNEVIETEKTPAEIVGASIAVVGKLQINDFNGKQYLQLIGMDYLFI